MASTSRAMNNQSLSSNLTQLISSITKSIRSIKPFPPLNPTITKTPQNIPQLSQFSPFLNPKLVTKIIKSQSNPHHALFFFNWASLPYPNPNRYTHSRTCYLAMYEVLLSHHLFASATQFLESHEIVSDATISMMIRAYGDARQFRAAIDAFHRANEARNGDCVKSCNALFKVLVKDNMTDLMRNIFDEVVKEGVVKLNVVSYTIVIRGFCKMGMVEDAQKVFEEMPVRPNLFTYCTLVGGYCRRGMVAKAREIVDMMIDRGGDCLPELVTYTTLIDGYCKKGEMEEALRCFDEMVVGGIEPSLVTYNAIVNGFCLVGEVDEARKMMSRMRDNGIKDDLVTHTSLLKGLCVAGRLVEALEHLKEVIKLGMRPDIKAYGVLLNECCKLGKANEAIDLLKVMMESGIRPNISCFNLVLIALVENQELDDAVHLLKRMPNIGFIPNFKSYSILVSSLSEAEGRAEEVEELVHCMTRDGNRPDAGVYSCRMKMYCKGNDLKNATRVFHESLDAGYLINLDSFAAFMEELCAKGMILEAEEHIQEMTKRSLAAQLDSYRRVSTELICKYRKC